MGEKERGERRGGPPPGYRDTDFDLGILKHSSPVYQAGYPPEDGEIDPGKLAPERPGKCDSGSSEHQNQHEWRDRPADGDDKQEAIDCEISQSPGWRSVYRRCEPHQAACWSWWWWAGRQAQYSQQHLWWAQWPSY